MHVSRLLFALLSASLVLEAAKAPITHEAMWLMKRVGAPSASPDGKWVVFPVTNPAYDDAQQTSDLWIVPTDQSAKPRQLTYSKGSEGGVTWSPDSKRIAFTARRDGDEATQVYVLDLITGGEAMRITSLSTGASSPQFSPDGQWLLFQSTVYPGAADDEANKKAAAERKARKYRARVYESFPIRYWDRWLDDTTVHPFVQKLEPGAKAKDLLAGTQFAASPGFAGASSLSGQDLQAVWAPDGQSIVFAAAQNKNQSAHTTTTTHLYQQNIAGGEPRALTAGERSFTRPQFRPDGQALYALESREGNQQTYSLNRLAMIRWPRAAAGAPAVLTEKFDRSVGSVAFTPDSRTIYLTAEDAGHEKIYSMPADGGEVKQAVNMTRGVYAGLTIPSKAASPVLIANWESASNPMEVVRVDVAANRHVNLTDFNVEKAAALDLPELRHFWFTSKKGRRIHNMVALPPGFDESKKYPLFVVIHGGPHSMYRDQFFLRWNYHLLAAPGYVVLLTDYSGSTGYGEAFARSVQGDPLATIGDELNEAADEAIRQFRFIDGTRQAAGGASYGGHLANWLQATTTRYKCLISHAGLVNLESQWATSDVIWEREINNGGPVWEQGKVWREQNPIRRAPQFKTPMLITVGENDFRVPLNNSLENYSLHQRLKIPTKLIVFPEENHWVMRGENSKFFYQEVQAWLAKYINN